MQYVVINDSYYNPKKVIIAQLQTTLAFFTCREMGKFSNGQLKKNLKKEKEKRGNHLNDHKDIQQKRSTGDKRAIYYPSL